MIPSSHSTNNAWHPLATESISWFGAPRRDSTSLHIGDQPLPCAAAADITPWVPENGVTPLFRNRETHDSRGEAPQIRRWDFFGLKAVQKIRIHLNPSGNPRPAWRVILLHIVKERTARLGRYREWQTHPASATARFCCVRC